MPVRLLKHAPLLGEGREVVERLRSVDDICREPIRYDEVFTHARFESAFEHCQLIFTAIPHWRTVSETQSWLNALAR